MDALVTDVYLPNAVSGLRGLGRAGLQLLALGQRRSSPGLWSRFASARAIGPPVLDDPDGFAARVAQLALEHGPLVVYPGREEAINALVTDSAPTPAGMILPYPGSDALNVLRDKRRLAELATGVGLGAPRTMAELTARELLSLASPPLPCAVKPAHPQHRSAMGGTFLFDSEDALRAKIGSIPPDEPLLVQERVGGAITSIGMVIARDGRVAARFQDRHHDTWPSDAGSFSAGVSVTPDERLVERAARLLAECSYWGLAELEFVQRGDDHLLFDCNPRFYTSMSLALACGVNLPAAWHAVTLDRAVPSPGAYRVGVRYRWLAADASAFVSGAPARLMRVGPRPVAGPMWAADDPLPGALLGLDAVALRVRLRARHGLDAMRRRTDVMR
jgi:predicted ATP-grasp superfamily ATP-dependent carboligase